MERTFLDRFHGRESLARKANFIDELLSFVRRGCQDQYERNRLIDGWSEFEASVKAQIGEAFRAYADLTIPKRWKFEATPESDFEEVLKAFEKGLKWTRDAIHATPLFRDEERCRLFEARFGSRSISLGDDYEKEPNVVSAAKNSVENLDLAEARYIAFNVICSLVNPRGNIDLRGGAVRARLFERMKHFSLMALLFANLTHDKDLIDSITRRLAKEFLVNEDKAGIQFSCIEHLHRDGFSPGMYPSSASEGLADSMRAALKKAS